LLGDHAPQIDWMGRDTPYVTRSQTTAQVLAADFPGIWNAKIRHRPPQPSEVTAVLQAQAAFVVVPSSWDVFNFTCVEAMAAGTPVICSSGAGASHWIEDGVNGFRFDRENAASLADALRRLLALGEEKRRAIGDNGRQTIAAAFDPEKIATVRLQAYEALIRSASVPLSADDWLRRAAGPGREHLDGLRLLDHLPLRGISRYVIERAFKTVRRA
jgi:glycosyltransferase involved in cell wall biosynthesis